MCGSPSSESARRRASASTKPSSERLARGERGAAPEDPRFTVARSKSFARTALGNSPTPWNRALGQKRCALARSPAAPAAALALLLTRADAAAGRSHQACTREEAATRTTRHSALQGSQRIAGALATQTAPRLHRRASRLRPSSLGAGLPCPAQPLSLRARAAAVLYPGLAHSARCSAASP